MKRLLYKVLVKAALSLGDLGIAWGIDLSAPVEWLSQAALRVGIPK